MMRNVMLNIDKLSTYEPTTEEKNKFIKNLEKIKKQWALD
tara:strand:- start:182 stop:301 length:120 start_codon:yes stop_codon:yes gene_type:complete